MRRVLLFIVALTAASRPAHAGRSFYGWLFGTEVMPERQAELATWISELNDQQGRSQTDWGVSPLIGITDRLELALPIEVQWVPGNTALHDYGVELRYRFVTQDLVEAPAFAPLVRVAVNRLVLARDTVQPELDLVASYQAGRFHGLIDLGLTGEISRDRHHFAVRPGAGISIRAAGDLRIGAEVFGELSLDDNGRSWFAVGPNLAWSHGRTWISASYGVGVYRLKDAPRLQWGIAF